MILLHSRLIKYWNPQTSPTTESLAQQISYKASLSLQLRSNIQLLHPVDFRWKKYVLSNSAAAISRRTAEQTAKQAHKTQQYYNFEFTCLHSCIAIYKVGERANTRAASISTRYSI